MKNLSDFSLVFCKKIERCSKSYSHTRVPFDEYKLYLLKKKAGAKRATNSQANLNYYSMMQIQLYVLSKV